MYKLQGNKELFDEEFIKERLSVIGRPLEVIKKVLDFNVFRELLESKLLNTNKKNNAGAEPYDVVMLFKIFILQRYYGLGDSQVEYQILDSCSFKTFLGLATGDNVPDEKIVWSFRERLTKTSLVEELFEHIVSFLEEKELIFNEGQMIDASCTVAPRQRNTREENKSIKNGEGNNLWNDKPNKKNHKDIDACWTKKNGETFYGYKNQAKVDTKSKFINTYTITDASVHDSEALNDLFTEKNKEQDLYADRPYPGEDQDKIIEKHEMKNKVDEKGYRNRPLIEEQKASNTEKSKIRARIEHVFGFMEQSMKGLVLKSVGIVRAT
jgi:IS5 family transposase